MVLENDSVEKYGGIKIWLCIFVTPVLKLLESLKLKNWKFVVMHLKSHRNTIFPKPSLCV